MNTSKQIVLAAVEFTGPGRAPVDYWTTRGMFTDFHGVGPNYSHDENRRIEGDFELWEDFYGNTWARLASDKLTKGEPRKGALDSWDKLEDYRLPSLVEDKPWTHIPSEIAAHRDKFILGSLPGMGFAVMRYLRGMENFLMDVAAEPERLETLHRKVMASLIDMVERYGRTGGVDGVFFAEDWGTQERLLINPAAWRALFKPHFRSLCKCAHSFHMKVVMHSCGYLGDILDDLVEVGVDVLQFDQQQNYGIDFLDKKIGGKAALYSPVDIQHTLVTGDRAKIRRECFELVEKIGGHRGGFIAKSYGGENSLRAIQCDFAWNDYAFDCFMEASRNVYGASYV